MWSFTIPTQVHFGVGSLAKIGDLINGRKYCLVTYNHPPFDAHSRRIEEIAGPAQALITNVDTNPDFKSLRESCIMGGVADEIEVIVALGGGSVIDTAKVMSACDGDFANFQRLLETGEGREALSDIPIIAIPTTSGTGSEVTGFATVWDMGSMKKHSLNLPGPYCESALVDPELTLGAPRGLTISTGLDALSHAMEGIWNINANPATTSMAVTAAREVIDVLPALADDLDNLELRMRMSRAALIAGISVSNTRTALAHSLSYAITLEHGIPHGIACSFSLPDLMRCVSGFDADCDAALKQIFGQDLAAGADDLTRMLKKLGVQTRAQDFGVTPEKWRKMVQLALEGVRGRNFIGDQAVILKTLVA
jgi:phosphonate metabolism-associated iron-containing alcohol dehydrogenase